MRLAPPLAAAALVAAAVSAWEPAGAQSVRATLEAAATVVETPSVRVDARALTFTGTRDGIRIAAPLRVSGAGSPSVAVATGAGERGCRTVPSANGPRLSCFVARPSTRPGEVAEIEVTLLVVTAT
jgi:hypothetical protein